MSVHTVTVCSVLTFVYLTSGHFSLSFPFFSLLPSDETSEKFHPVNTMASSLGGILLQFVKVSLLLFAKYICRRNTFLFAFRFNTLGISKN